MKLAVMQPYFMPYIGYWQLIKAVDKFIPYDNVSFMKKGWINRNRILRKDGCEYFFTVPLCKKSSFKNISEVEIDNTLPWKKKLLSDIYFCYKKAKFFDEFYPILQDLLSEHVEFISTLCNQAIMAVSGFIGLDTAIDCNNFRFRELEKALESINDDYSPYPELNATQPDRKTARVIEICRIEHADCYINPCGGQDLYEKEEFAKYGIDLKFVETGNIRYQQNTKEDNFVPNLSIIDVLMNVGKDGTLSLLDNYSLV